MRQEGLVQEIDELWVGRPSIDKQWERYRSGLNTAIIVGPSRSGKSFYAMHRHLVYSREKPSDEGSSKNTKEKWRLFRYNLGSEASLIVDFRDYWSISNPTLFFRTLQNDILRELDKSLGFEDRRLQKAFVEKIAFSFGSARGFMRAIAYLFSTKKPFYKGKVIIFLTGIHYLHRAVREPLFDYIRAFIDTAPGDAGLERFRIVLSSLRDVYQLTSYTNRSCSPLDCLHRIYMYDLNYEEYLDLLGGAEKGLQLFVREPEYLYSFTEGDVYLTKVIMSHCFNLLVNSPEDLKKKKRVIDNTLISHVVDAISNPGVDEWLPPFRVLQDFIRESDEVREVLSDILSGASSVPITDTTGTYTIPESSGAVKKKFKQGKYVYTFRNEIYRRVVEKYFKQEQHELDTLLLNSTAANPAIFASAIRHELGGPMTLISGAIGKCVRYKDSPENLNSALDEFRNGIEKLSEIVRFLDSFKDSTHGVEKFSLNDFLKKTFSIFDRQLSRSNIRLLFHLDGNINEVILDTVALRIALINLITNARNAIQKKGKGTIIMITKIRPGKQLEIAVKDDGIGMSKATSDLVMSFGFVKKADGRGIGLSLCRAAVGRMGGEMKIESKLGKGTKVQIVLPLRIANENETNPDS